jgi:hypothetical protein
LEAQIGQVVIVHWLDIVQKAGCEGHPIRPARCTTWGQLVRVDAETITVLMERSDDDYTYQVFPTGCVTEVDVR